MEVKKSTNVTTNVMFGIKNPTEVITPDTSLKTVTGNFLTTKRTLMANLLFLLKILEEKKF